MAIKEAKLKTNGIYFINLWKPPLNVDDKAGDSLTMALPELQWMGFVPSHWEEWKKQLAPCMRRSYNYGDDFIF